MKSRGGVEGGGRRGVERGGRRDESGREKERKRERERERESKRESRGFHSRDYFQINQSMCAFRLQFLYDLFSRSPLVLAPWS